MTLGRYTRSIERISCHKEFQNQPLHNIQHHAVSAHVTRAQKMQNMLTEHVIHETNYINYMYKHALLDVNMRHIYHATYVKSFTTARIS